MKTHQIFLVLLILPGLAMPVFSQPGRWSEPYNISNNEWGSTNPDMAVAPDGRFHLVWDDFSRLGYLQSHDILYSVFDGHFWSEPVIISGVDTTFSRLPRIAVDSDGYPHIVWVKNWLLSPEIYYSALTDSGWTEPLNLSTLTGYSHHPDIAIDGNDYVHVVWYDNCFGNIDIVHTYYNGEEWSELINVSEEYYTSLDPRIVADSESNVYLVWSASTGADSDICYSLFNGVSWSPHTILSHTPTVLSKEPNIALDISNNPYVVWQESQGANHYEIYYCYKQWEEWTEPVDLTDLGGYALYPTLAIADDNTKCLLFEYRLNGSDDPYMNYMIEYEGIWTYPDSVSIEYRGSSQPAISYYNGKFHACIQFAFAVYGDIGYTFYELPNSKLPNSDNQPTKQEITIHPNPFNDNVSINFNLLQKENTNLSIFNISGQLVTILCDDYLDKGNHRFDWNGTDQNGVEVSGGVYFVRLLTATESSINKVIYLK